MEGEAGSDDDGNPLIRAKKLEEIAGIQKIYIDFEGRTPTGTHKDRIAKVHTERAFRDGYSAITIGTCGNYGVAIAYYARVYGLKAHIFIPAGYTLKRTGEMLAYGAEIIPVHGPYEKAVFESRKFARENRVYDANPGSNPDVDYSGYSTIAEEVLSRTRPDAIFVPVGNGTTLAGIYRGFTMHGVKPRLIKYRDEHMATLPERLRKGLVRLDRDELEHSLYLIKRHDPNFPLDGVPHWHVEMLHFDGRNSHFDAIPVEYREGLYSIFKGYTRGYVYLDGDKWRRISREEALSGVLKEKENSRKIH